MPPKNALRDQIAALGAAVAPDQTATKAVLPFGIGKIDDQLACGGLITQALHEIAPTTSTLSDDACAALFTAGIAVRFASAPNANVLWALSRYDLYAPGLEQVGLGPAKLIHAEAREDADVLALVEDAARHGAFAAVVGEVRKASMTALRRLQLVAEDAGVPVLLLRRWKRAARCPLSEPSVATTRWRIGAVPSAPLGVPGIGKTRWSIELVRQRGGHPFSTLAEGCDATGRLASLADVRDRASPASGAIIQRAA